MTALFWGVEYLASFIESLMCCYFCNTFLAKEDEEDVRPRFVPYALTIATFLFCMNQVELFSLVTSSLSVGLCIVMQWHIYKKHYLLSVALTLIYLVLMSVVDLVILHLYALLGGTTTAYIVEGYSIARVMCILLSKSILLIVVISINKAHVDKRVIPTKYILLSSLCSIFLLVSNLVLTQLGISREHDDMNALAILFFIASLGIELIVFGLILRIAEAYEQKKLSMFIEMNNSMLQKELDERENAFSLWRESIHDYHNKIIALSMFAEADNMEKIKEFLKNEKESLSQQLFYIKTGNAVVDRIMNMKRQQSERYGISFVVDADIPENLVMEDVDMASVLGNLIDNAIEAEQKEDTPYIEIRMKQEKNFFCINIRNKCTTALSNKKLRTTKEHAEFHGIGLSSVRRTVKKYHGELHLEMKDGEFVACVIIPK